MRKYIIKNDTTISVNEKYEAEPLEKQIEKIITNNEPLEKGAPIIYTDRKEGVKPEYDIRTDRFDVAMKAMDKVSATAIAKREAKAETEEGSKTGQAEKNGANEPVGVGEAETM